MSWSNVNPWTAAELEIIRQNADGIQDHIIAQKLVKAGFSRRSVEAVRKARTHKLKLVRKTGKHGKRRLTNPSDRELKNNPPKYQVGTDEQLQYWGKAKRADAAFQARLFMAGVRRETVTTPCTENPLAVRAEPTVRQSGGFVYPEEGPR